MTLTELTETITRKKYLEAQAELDSVLRSRDATTQQKRAALDAMDELDRQFLRRTTESIAARTAQFKEFTVHLQTVIDTIERAGSPIDTIKRLRALAEEANELLERAGA